MPSTALKEKLPPEILIDFLEPICTKSSEYYIVNYETYRRAIYTSHYTDFIEKIRPYYFTCQLHFLDREINYKKFLTTLRQICSVSEFKYQHIRAFDRSKSKTAYYIYFDTLGVEPIPINKQPFQEYNT